MKFVIQKRLLGIFVILSFLLSSCAIKVAPSYDQQLIVGLNDLSARINTYFESMSGDLASKKYVDSESTYNQIIGLTQSLVTQSDARPVPDSKAVKKINQLLEKNNKELWDPQNNLPSTVALKGILTEFKKLKSIHEDGSINPTKYELRMNSIKLYLEQAIVFEYALER